MYTYTVSGSVCNSVDRSTIVSSACLFWRGGGRETAHANCAFDIFDCATINYAVFHAKALPHTRALQTPQK